ncbi:MAG TPA: M28 family peptidase [Terriglobales bacterium]|jgi:Zn-dependent M28 family amino/carboxypeptidase|nr:M28 family peptidase [Terriglobales bacterium]
MRKTLTVILSILVSVTAFSQKKQAEPGAMRMPPAAFAAMQSINPERMRAHTRFLSHDLLEGRGTGQRGGDIAAEYIATQFATYGLKPAGDNGSYMQRVPMVGITPMPDTKFALVGPGSDSRDLKVLDDYVAYDQTQKPQSDVNADIVFVGYGIEAPEYNWDDYKGVDVKGKVLLMLVNEPGNDDPKFFKGRALTYYGRWTYKYEEAARKGAVGAILIHRTDMASYGWEVVRNSNSGEKSYLELDGTPKLKVAAWVQLAVAEALAKKSGLDLNKLMADARTREFKPVPLQSKLIAHMVSKVRPFSSNNVIGVLPGSDPKRKDEAVMYTAHYDHLGIRPDMPGDNVYNGADDNATGCAILLELAQVFGSAAQKPPRSVIFASVTAEEQGLLGSEYLGKHTPIPAGKITLDLNYDDVPPLGAPEEVEVSGAERTSFYPVVESLAKEFRLEIKPDSRPEAGHYYRSDHFSLARVGIPAFSVNQGMKFKGHDEAWGRAQADDYTAKHYHQPSDEYHPEMDFTSDAAMARFGFALGWEASSLPHLVGWEKGDEFEKARLGSK